MDQLAVVKDICRRMEDLAADAGLPRFDRVRLVSDHGQPDEVWFLWEGERKLAVVVGLDADPDALASALTQAAAGDPAMN